MAQLPKMAIAFVIRRCIMELGHAPTAVEFADWANHPGRDLRPFGRSITEQEATAMLRNQDRLVSARSAAANERHIEQHELPPNVISLSAVRAQLGAQRSRRTRR
jgi:hypothetical protein